MKFRIEYQGTSWFIVDQTTPGVRVRIDQALVDASYIAPDRSAVEGYILSVHGLDFDVASVLDRHVLNQLGVAANLRSIPPPPRGANQRVRLMDTGRIARP